MERGALVSFIFPRSTAAGMGKKKKKGFSLPPPPLETHRCQTAFAQKLVCKHTSGKPPDTIPHLFSPVGAGNQP